MQPDGVEDDDCADVVLPDEVLLWVFSFCDARTRMMTLPSVSKRWLGVCQNGRAEIDLAWAVRGGYRGAITDAVLAGLVGRFPKLQLLNLRRCLNVTDGGLEAVAAGCTKLHHLDLTGCEDVTDDGVAAVAAGCPKLRHLNLYDCRNVTDGGLEAVAAGCHDLQHLDLTGCEEVTDGGLEAVAAGCPDLQHLDLTGCDSVTFRGTALFPNAELIDYIWC